MADERDNTIEQDRMRQLMNSVSQAIAEAQRRDGTLRLDLLEGLEEIGGAADALENAVSGGAGQAGIANSPIAPLAEAQRTAKNADSANQQPPQQPPVVSPNVGSSGAGAAVEYEPATPLEPFLDLRDPPSPPQSPQPPRQPEPEPDRSIADAASSLRDSSPQPPSRAGTAGEVGGAAAATPAASPPLPTPPPPVQPPSPPPIQPPPIQPPPPPQPLAPGGAPGGPGGWGGNQGAASAAVNAAISAIAGGATTGAAITAGLGAGALAAGVTAAVHLATRENGPLGAGFDPTVGGPRAMSAAFGSFATPAASQTIAGAADRVGSIAGNIFGTINPGYGILTEQGPLGLAEDLASLPGEVERWGQSLRQSTEHLTAFNGQIAIAHLAFERDQMIRNVRSGAVTAGTTEGMIDALSELLDEIQPIRDTITNVSQATLTAILHKVTTLVDMAGRVLFISDNLAEFIPVVGPQLAELIRKMTGEDAAPPTDTPMVMFMRHFHDRELTETKRPKKTR